MNRNLRVFAWLVAIALFGAVAPASTEAQGVTTSAVTGRVTDSLGAPLPGVQIIVTQTATGVSRGILTRSDGRYLLPGLAPGGPYRIEARSLGRGSEVIDGITLALGQTSEFNFELVEQAVALEGIEVTTERAAVISRGRTGASSVIGQETLENTPTLTRDFTALARLTPQISTDGNAANAGGRNSKFNNIQIDGAANNDLFGLGSGGTPGNDAGAKPISIEAIQEFQVVIAPFDVRQGGFTGAGVNAITKSGTNDFNGTISYFGRNDALTGNFVDFGGNRAPDVGSFTDQGFAFSLGGPILQDKLHFFVAGEFSERNAPNGGVAIGRDANIELGEVQPIADYLRNTYGYESGELGEVTMNRFSNNLFGRLDYQINDAHSLILRHNWVDAGDDNLSRSNSFYMVGNAGYEKSSITNTTVAQLNSRFGNRVFNELRFGLTSIDDERRIADAFPFITVELPNSRTVAFGPDNFSPANALTQDVFQITNDLTFTAGRHTFTLGTHNELFSFSNLFVRNAFGNYTFASFADLQAGTPKRYEYSYRLPGGKERAEFDVRQHSVYAQDQISLTDNFTVTAGLRYDVSYLPDTPTDNPLVAAAFPGRSTTEVPSGNGLFNPRVGFNWDVLGDRTTQLRGGLGLFSGRTPYVWISNAYGNTGADYVSFTCGHPATAPAFVADVNAQPTNCEGTTSAAPNVINLVDPDFNFPQVFRTSLAVDRELPFGFFGTLEGIYTQSVHDVLYRELTVGEAVGTVEGRPRYSQDRAGFSSVTDVTNTDENYSYSITGQLQRGFADGWDASVAYTFGKAFDVTSTTSSQAYSNWRYNPIDGDPNDPALRPSNFDVRHRIVAHGGREFNLIGNAPTRFSLVYVGESGRPFSYTYASSDINGDGSRDNDLIYVPASASEIRFQGTPEEQAASWAALDALINDVSCLSAARGSVLQRNACRLPWSNQFDLRVSQSVPSIARQHLELFVDVINVGNLLNSDWGKSQYVPNQNDALLRAANTTPDAEGRVLFQPFSGRSNVYSISDLSSRYQIQLGARYVF